ncbi:MAG TPA: hypothetical protein PKE07_00495 [Lacibacter sp.]|nr:hypothetical protein [Lacibacter sp.]HMO88224.1 hypothetical protein [Lacibacter sp.]
MKRILHAFWYSFPVQLLFLHFRKYQLLLLFWFLLGSAISGGFMSHFGANSLFVAPEYLGRVSFWSSLFTGAAYGVFIMSWNITTFILYSSYFKFLATTSKPFLKYCFNNGVLPLLFLLNYLVQVVRFDRFRELMSTGEILLLALGFTCGLLLFILFAFFYFYGSEKAILRTLRPVLHNPRQFLERYKPIPVGEQEAAPVRVDHYFSGFFSVRKTRNVSHYSQQFLDLIFKRHNFAAVIAIVLAFLFLMVYGFFLDTPYLQLPAAASIFVFFSILIAASGALAYWLDTWSIPVALLLVLLFNFLFRYEYIDIRNKAFGLNYEDRAGRPAYSLEALSRLCTPEQVQADSLHMINILNRWKARQPEQRPLLYVINVSGGGNRSATFSFRTLCALDSALGGQLLPRTILFSGASGGMLGATFFRELYRRRQSGDSSLGNPASHTSAIARDLLNPIFSAYVTRDLITPVQKFAVGPYRYVKDRGYAFEQQLLHNTGGILHQRLEDYREEEAEARLPIGLFNATVSQDGRRLMICSQPVSYLMRPQHDSAHGITAEPDAIDYNALFHALNPGNLRLLTALRMNATFPYVLPNVWLPTQPIVDVMDAGLRDNYGQEATLRFLHVFAPWIREHTGGVVFIQIRDRKKGDWQEDFKEPSIADILYKPVTTLQTNFYKVQDYLQESLLSISRSGLPLHRFLFIYEPEGGKKGAALSFHLTEREKQDIIRAVYNPRNQSLLNRLVQLQQEVQGSSSR